MATFGIDLGTTYSCISYVDDSGKPVIVPNAEGRELTPSVVYFESPHNVVVGEQAKDAAKSDAERVVALIKRQMGNRDTEFDFDGVSYTPESVSAFIVRDLARSARRVIGTEATDAVITVPAYFGVSERHATRLAGEIAGLNVVSVVPEPVAAALHYGALSASEARTILVYDLGGGTFDTTVIKLHGGDVTVVCTDGDHHLGGADWDDRIVTYLAECFVAAHPEAGADESESFLQGLGLIAEETKIALSSRTTKRQLIQFGGARLNVDLTRETFEEITADLLNRTLEITARTLRVAEELDAGRPDTLLLVGGSTIMPAVARVLGGTLGLQPHLHDPHLAVAKGAAMFALQESIRVRLAGEKTPDSDDVKTTAEALGVKADTVRALAAKKVTIVVPRAFGVGVVARDTKPEDGKTEVRHLLEANTPLPSPKITEQFFTAVSDQTSILITIYEQAGAEVSHLVEFNNPIGEGVISRLPLLPKGSPVDITFSMNETGLLTVDASELTTGQKIRIEVQIGGLDEKRVHQAREAVARLS
ncbi:Hsp70 family protein [Paractinoplanes globisporus]|uniref:Hsp70 family protein n=1 Tax=Paractinoplanes globisporus TaxID=113565 RepID=A0ABW6W761_9ACTN|nr:Hsp70 family protein [Actinoplanes globisporus]